MALMPGKNIMCTSTNLYNSQNVSEEMETVELYYNYHVVVVVYKWQKEN